MIGEVFENIIANYPLPVVRMQTEIDDSSGHIQYSVIDGAKILQAIFDIIDTVLIHEDIEVRGCFYRYNLSIECYYGITQEELDKIRLTLKTLE